MSTVNQAHWMSAIDDATCLNRMSILGSHESCALEGFGPTQCQSLSIPEQLNRGVRFLDIRPVYAKDAPTDHLPIMHNTVDQSIDFGEGEQQCRDFLEKHPSETILMNVQQELNGGLRNHSGESFLERFLQVVHSPWWTFLSSDKIPTLKDCRNKIVLVRSYDSLAKEGWPSEANGHKLPGNGGLAWNGFCNDGESRNKYFVTQNGWKKYETSRDKTSNGWDEANHDKVEAVKDWMRKSATAAKNGKDEIYVNFASRAAGAYVGSAAEDINKHLVNYLNGDFQKAWPATDAAPLGIVALDFVGNTGVGSECLEAQILQYNPFKKGSALKYT